jgi:hypothetical protein
MRYWLKFHRDQRRLRHWLADIDQRHDEAVVKLKNASAEQLRDLGWEFHTERCIAQEELSRVMSARIVTEARRLFIPVPEFKTENGAWIESEFPPGRRLLSIQAMSELRSAIRREKKERHEGWLLWLAAITGLVGALTGLAAVIRT